MHIVPRVPHRASPRQAVAARWLCLAPLTTLAIAPGAFAAPPPAPDNLTENAVASWGAQADGATAAVFDDTDRVHVGAASLRFETTGGFDTWLWAPLPQDAEWNLLQGGAGGLAFWAYAENPNFGFQNASPWVRLYSSPSDYFEFRPTWDLLNTAMGQWVEFAIPYAGNAVWIRQQVGSPTLTAVRFIEIHADTWDAGFTLWIDGLRFDLPLSPPQGLTAYALNARVDLAWDPWEDLTGQFDHYAVYRDTAAFTSVAGMTPIATLPDLSDTEYADLSAENGTSYYYAVTAVLADGSETTDVQSVGPRTPRDETDLQVVSIARTPRYPRYDPIYTYYEITEPSGFGPYIFSAATGLGGGQSGDTQRWPAVDDPVTYTATVRNRGTNPWTTPLQGTWRVDGGTVQQSSTPVNLAPGERATFSLVWPWDGTSHAIEFSIDAADSRAANNVRAIDTRSVAFLSYVDRTYLENFREDTSAYPLAATDDFLDWLNRHMDRFNQMFADADCLKRVHFDVLDVLADDAPDPSTPTIFFAVFPFRYHAKDGSLRLSGYYSPGDDIDFGLLHEMGHQLGLIDLYRLDLGPENNQVSATGYSAGDCLMRGCSPFLSAHSANAMTHWLNTAHGYFGQYLYRIPQQVRVRFLGSDGAPLAGANVYVYQKAERPGLGEIITAQVKAQGQTDAQGEYTLPNVPIDPQLVPPTFAGDVLSDNPFGYVAVVGTNGLLLLKVEHQGFVDYAWLDITEVNNAYAAGHTQTAVFERHTSLGGCNQQFPPPDLNEANAADWTAWAQEGAIALVDDDERTQVGGASLRIEATGGYDNYARYPGSHLAAWDLSGLTEIHFWAYAENPNIGFQSGSPWIRIGDANGYVEWRNAFDHLNLAIGQWHEFVVPESGSPEWQRSVFGAPDLAAVSYVELHADTWGAGFTLWLDGLRFLPPASAPLGDLDCSGTVDSADVPHVVTALIDPAGYVASHPCCDLGLADLNGDASVDGADVPGFVNLLAGGAPQP